MFGYVPIVCACQLNRPAVAGTDAEVGEAWVQQHTRMIADGMKSIGIQPDE